APAPAPAVAAKAEPKAAPTSAIAEVEAAVRAWAAAWSRQDMNAYYAAYTPDFKGQSANRHAWEQERRDRISPRKRTAVERAQIHVPVNGKKAQARFRKRYAPATLDVRSRKTLELVRGNSGKWQIRSESVG